MLLLPPSIDKSVFGEIEISSIFFFFQFFTFSSSLSQLWSIGRLSSNPLGPYKEHSVPCGWSSSALLPSQGEYGHCKCSKKMLRLAGVNQPDGVMAFGTLSIGPTNLWVQIFANQPCKSSIKNGCIEFYPPGCYSVHVLVVKPAQAKYSTGNGTSSAVMLLGVCGSDALKGMFVCETTTSQNSGIFFKKNPILL